MRVAEVDLYVGSDRDQLSSMAKQAREAMASDTLAVVTDLMHKLYDRHFGLSVLPKRNA
ncbi:hypothetical protein [Pseudomonas baetica]|uniref:hypothetical protein n=1 Tax=Pseudomonas baetica TaxID=674054 RepID=UPI0024055CAD|nr:hypothetical protein [Pseudomonas baetica]MDF9773778.1 hypothetical protein [Pseudomonas baetica]